jgi:hypothetical protein
LDLSSGSSLGEEAMGAFNESLRDGFHASACLKSWSPPAGTSRYGAEWEIRLVRDDRGYVVEDVRVRDATLSDAELEDCVRRTWIERIIPLGDDLAVSRVGPERARIVFPVAMYFGKAPVPSR